MRYSVTIFLTDETIIGGVQTDLGFHRWLVEQPSFVTGDYDTGLVAEAWGQGPPLAEELGVPSEIIERLGADLSASFTMPDLAGFLGRLDDCKCRPVVQRRQFGG